MDYIIMKDLQKVMSKSPLNAHLFPDGVLRPMLTAEATINDDLGKDAHFVTLQFVPVRFSNGKKVIYFWQLVKSDKYEILV